MTTLERHTVYSVERMKDGDTMVVLVELGLDTLRRIDLRLSIVDTPETNSPDPEVREAGELARLFSWSWVMERQGLGELAVELERTRTGSYRMTFGRFLGSLFHVETGDSLSSALLERGLAEVWS